jgi:hypothetical protein
LIASFERDLELEEQRLREIEDNLDGFTAEKANPFSYWSATEHLDGSVTIHNKPTEASEMIMTRYY